MPTPTESEVKAPVGAAVLVMAAPGDRYGHLIKNLIDVGDEPMWPTQCEPSELNEMVAARQGEI